MWNGGSISGQTDVSSGSSTTTYRVNINLYNANFKDAVLNKVAFQSVNFDSNCTFENADLYGSSFFVVDLHDSTFQNAKIAGAEFIDSGFNKTMLQSTASYKNKDLQGLFLASNGGPIDFSGVDFSGVNLREATFIQVNLSGANFTSADLRGSMMFGDTSGAIYKNTVTSYGCISNISMESDSDKIIIQALDERAASGASASNAMIISDANMSAGTIEIGGGEKLEIADGVVVAMSDQIKIVFDADYVGGVEDLLVLGDGASVVMAGYDSDEAARAAFVNLFEDSDGNSVDWAPDSVADFVSAAVPEPAAWAAIFGAFALALAAYRKRA